MIQRTSKHKVDWKQSQSCGKHLSTKETDQPLVTSQCDARIAAFLFEQGQVSCGFRFGEMSRQMSFFCSRLARNSFAPSFISSDRGEIIKWNAIFREQEEFVLLELFCWVSSFWCSRLKIPTSGLQNSICSSENVCLTMKNYFSLLAASPWAPSNPQCAKTEEAREREREIEV